MKMVLHVQGSLCHVKCIDSMKRIHDNVVDSKRVQISSTIPRSLTHPSNAIGSSDAGGELTLHVYVHA